MSLHRAVQYHNTNGGSGVPVSRRRRVAHVDDAQPTFHPPIFQDLYHFPSYPLLSRFVRSSSGCLDDRYVAACKHRKVYRNRVATGTHHIMVAQNDAGSNQDKYACMHVARAEESRGHLKAQAHGSHLTM